MLDEQRIQELQDEIQDHGGRERRPGHATEPDGEVAQIDPAPDGPKAGQRQGQLEGVANGGGHGAGRRER